MKATLLGAAKKIVAGRTAEKQDVQSEELALNKKQMDEPPIAGRSEGDLHRIFYSWAC